VTQDLGRRLSKLTPIPRIRVPVEISRNLWGQEGFDPRYVSLMGKYAKMGDKYSDLYALSRHLGIQMPEMVFPRPRDPRVRVTGAGGKPGIRIE
jgi:hypothetical protein